jgi:transposase-like protein
MRKSKIIESRFCPQCGSNHNQVNAGINESGTQRCFCKACKKYYTLNPKVRAYSEEVRDLAIKEYLSGVSGRGVGKIHGMSKANVYNWIKKNRVGVDILEN